jgi:1-acyl-sn-glycerol-3-phosphate acyltransferase
MNRDASTPFHERVLRYARLVIHLLSGLLTVAFLFPFWSRLRRWRAVENWSRRILRSAGVEVSITGDIPGHGARVLGVANHVSWLDIQVLHSIWNVRFVAKSEVRNWPLIGWLSARTGTLFIDRRRMRHAARINRSIHAAFAEGDAVAVFPEGTTTRGDQLLRFHASLLQPAIDEGARVVPVAIRYTDAAGRLHPAAAYVDEMTLLESISAIIRVPRIVARVRFLPPIDPAGRSRRELAEISHGSIASALSLPASNSQL